MKDLPIELIIQKKLPTVINLNIQKMNYEKEWIGQENMPSIKK